MTLYRIGKLFLDEYISSFDKAPKKIIVDADDTNANTYGAQQLSMVDKQKRRAESDYLKAQKVEDDRYETLKRLKYPDVRHERIVIRRYYKLEYKAQSWKYAQRVIAKIEVSAEGTNIRFVPDQEQEQLTRDRLQALLRTWRDGVVDKGPEVFQG